MSDALATAAPLPTSIADVKRNWLDAGLGEIERHTDKDVLLMLGYLEPGLEIRVRLAIEQLEKRRACLLVILYTQGGAVEVVKHIVQTIRNFYGKVHFLVPAQAMSAGRVRTLSFLTERGSVRTLRILPRMPALRCDWVVFFFLPIGFSFRLQAARRRRRAWSFSTLRPSCS